MARNMSLLMLAPGASAQQLSTPRLREYFPETLVWQPSLETDKQGRAQLQFKLADNITTWKMSVIGSTEDGQVGVVEKEIKSFQPFFVEHDPPRVLTEGDEISLPVVVRNYLDRAQTVNLEIKPESWFTLLGERHQRRLTLPPATQRAARSISAPALRSTTASSASRRLASDANDAIEKPVTVHPDGEEKSVTASDIVSSSSNAHPGHSGDGDSQFRKGRAEDLSKSAGACDRKRRSDHGAAVRLRRADDLIHLPESAVAEELQANGRTRGRSQRAQKSVRVTCAKATRGC